MSRAGRLKVKICGLTRAEDARLAAELGAWAVGFIFHPASPRYLAPEAAADIIAALPPGVQSAGVFVNAERAHIEGVRARAGFTLLQLHGDEPPALAEGHAVPVIRAFRLRGAEEVGAIAAHPGIAYALIEAAVAGHYGGTGQLADWPSARAARAHAPVLLAGGLSPDNVAQAVRAVEPAGVDVSSGVEAAPGRKDPRALTRFFAAVRAAEESLP